MTSRPQFSLRMLLVVTTLVCLAAATVNEPPENEQLLRGALALLRAALCVTFSAALTLGAMRADGYLKSFYIGGAVAAALPLLVLVEVAARSIRYAVPLTDLDLLSDLMTRFVKKSSPHRWWFVMLWTSVPGLSLATAGFDRMFRFSGRGEDVLGAPTARRLAFRSALSIVVATCVTALVAIPTPGYEPILILQSLLAAYLGLFFVGALLVGAVQASGYFKTFCVGGALPALFALQWVILDYFMNMFYGLPSDTPLSLSLWLRSFGFDYAMRLILAAHWAMIPVLGAAFVACDWIWRRGRLNSKSE
ncbi:MAG TPA: hypothetical protein VF278_24255 [Pirellulales bacterium]